MHFRTSPVSRNIAANYSGSVWAAVVSLLAVPIYLRALGVEVYGLVGIFATLQALFAPLDAGLSASSSRELALISVRPDEAKRSRDVLRSVGSVYWMMAAAIGVVMMATAPLITTHWLSQSSIPAPVLTKSIMLMGLIVTMHWPLSFYTGALYGMQRQVLANTVNVAGVTLSAVGAIVIVTFVSPTPLAFFVWQAFATGCQTTAMMLSAWRVAPPSEGRARFDPALLKKLWRFAAGMSLVTVLAMLLTQIDKIVLSKIETLRVFGYYTLAWTVAASLSRIVSPVSQALAPRLVQLVSTGEQEHLARLYHAASQLMSVIVLPVALAIVIFAPEILFLWTGNATIAENVSPLVRLLMLGSMFSSMMNLPFQLQLAHGWVSLGVYTNLVAVAILIPLTVFLALRYGSIGAAASWPILNIGYVLIVIQIMHRRILPRLKWSWYVRDVGLPLAASALVLAFSRTIQPESLSKLPTLIFIGAAWGFATLAAFSVAPEVRTRMRSVLARASGGQHV